MARLDRLATVKSLAQLGATLGREFSYELLQAVSPWDEATLRRGLQQLVAAELLYQQGLPPQAAYRFKHALIQEAAYQSLLKSTRQQHHQHIAQVLEAHFPDLCETQPELLAHHYTEAGLAAQAIPYWQQAGQRATQRSANAEALSHLTTALELLKALPDTPERTQQEIGLTIALGIPLVATKGQASPEVARVYARAHELCQQVGEMPQLFPVLYGLFRFYFARGQHQTARDITAQLLLLAQREQDRALLLEAHRGLGTVACMLGEWTVARTHLVHGIALYEFHQHEAHAFLYGQDPGVMCLSSVAPVLWNLGYPDQALKRSQEALMLAQKRSHPHSLVLALDFAAWLHSLRREGQVAQEQAGIAMRLATAQGFTQWLAFGTILQGWALAEEGQEEEGIAQMSQGLAAYQATGAELWRPYFLALLAEACGKVDRVQDGRHVLAEALAIVVKNGERSCEAELHRLKGELLLQQAVPDAPQAKACFHAALDIARRQQAKSLELRAAMSLARLWQRQGKRAAAHALLAPIYDWFTEGFDTADLQEAKALLEALA
jgi:predicted ATPase